LSYDILSKYFLNSYWTSPEQLNSHVSYCAQTKSTNERNRFSVAERDEHAILLLLHDRRLAERLRWHSRSCRRCWRDTRRCGEHRRWGHSLYSGGDVSRLKETYHTKNAVMQQRFPRHTFILPPVPSKTISPSIPFTDRQWDKRLRLDSGELGPPAHETAARGRTSRCQEGRRTQRATRKGGLLDDGEGLGDAHHTKMKQQNYVTTSVPARGREA